MALVMALSLLAGPSTLETEQCKTEDSVGCAWYGSMYGNRQGHNFVN